MSNENIQESSLRPNHSKPTLLLVDDDPIIAETMSYLLEDEFDVSIAQTRDEAKALLNTLENKPKLALVDLGLPPSPHSPEEGFALISELLAYDSRMKILVLSGQDERTNIQHALTLGAIDFIPKPCDADLLKTRLEHQLMLLEAEAHKARESSKVDMIGSSLAMQSLVAQIGQFADAPFPVLIEGDSGTGKELIAQLLHDESKRLTKPYYVINCAAFTKDLLEAQLFGHAKGAFTGAMKEHAGFFEETGEGTLFMDEIAELPLDLQAKLLRVLENGEFYRLGETRGRQSKARIVAATNKDMSVEVRSGRFRQDLYHRLSILTIKVPQLSERGDDRVALLEHFKRMYAGIVPPFTMDNSAMKCWLEYTFPGNVRELRNLVIRLGTKYPGQTVTSEEVLKEIESGENPNYSSQLGRGKREEVLRQIQMDDFLLDEFLLNLEKSYVSIALDHCNGNLTQSAKLLKMNRTTLYSRLEKLGLK